MGQVHACAMDILKESLLMPSVGRCKRDMAEMCVKAVLAVADMERKDVNLELIKVQERA